VEDIFFVRLKDYATPVDPNGYRNASATMTVTGTVSPGLRVGLAFIGTFASSDDPSSVQMEQHYYYDVREGDSLETIAAGVANAINAFSSDIQTVASGSSINCQYRGSG
jgi:hypothetical protein